MASTRTSPRTPSRTSGKGVTPTQREPVHKCTWDSYNIKLFPQLVIAEMGDGNRQLCSLSMSGYKKLANKFLDRTGLLHSSKQIKNKYDNLKKDWITWKKLQDSSQGFTGIGYDHTLGLFTAPDHWWAKMQVMNHRCAKFKTKPLKHLDLIEKVFAGVTATRKHVWTPSEIRNTDAISDNVTTSDNNMGPLSGSTPPRDVPDRVGENVMDCSLFDDAPPHSTTDGSANAKRRKRAAPGTVASSMDNLVEAVSEKNRELKITQYIVTGNGENTVGDYLARLMTVPGLQGGRPLFLFACSLMDSPNNCDLIMGLPLDNIVNWLKEKRVITHQPVMVEWSPGVRLFGQDGVVDMN
ncbi:L10-interacting MYB domain-containing protein [Camellia lanceoleosa]|uniref:L10-interacting MYB domain-containing protein n=1 Tax=Camellia lanceoleosa TaxID=1840588 RepID=A0ACC0I7K9_9ERIC|nr:L10-interacting MYB domain-containing protein [Camellia lanceoleosa]